MLLSEQRCHHARSRRNAQPSRVDGVGRQNSSLTLGADPGVSPPHVRAHRHRGWV